MKKEIVLVQFGQPSEFGKEYAYFTLLDLKVGDVVVAQTPRQLAIVTVTTTEEISEEAARFAEKWIISLVDIDAHEAAVKALEENND